MTARHDSPAQPSTPLHSHPSPWLSAARGHKATASQDLRTSGNNRPRQKRTQTRRAASPLRTRGRHGRRCNPRCEPAAGAAAAAAPWLLLAGPCGVPVGSAQLNAGAPAPHGQQQQPPRRSHSAPGSKMAAPCNAHTARCRQTPQTKANAPMQMRSTRTIASTQRPCASKAPLLLRSQQPSGCGARGHAAVAAAVGATRATLLLRSQQPAERQLAAAEQAAPGVVVVAAGRASRHQIVQQAKG